MSSTELPQDLKEINGDINGVISMGLGSYQWGQIRLVVNNHILERGRVYVIHAEEKLSSKYIDTQEVK